MSIVAAGVTVRPNRPALRSGISMGRSGTPLWINSSVASMTCLSTGR